MERYVYVNLYWCAFQGGVLAEVVHDDGSLRRLPALQELAKEKGLVLTSVRDIIAYRLELERNQHQ